MNFPDDMYEVDKALIKYPKAFNKVAAWQGWPALCAVGPSRTGNTRACLQALNAYQDDGTVYWQGKERGPSIYMVSGSKLFREVSTALWDHEEDQWLSRWTERARGGLYTISKTFTIDGARGQSPEFKVVPPVIFIDEMDKWVFEPKANSLLYDLFNIMFVNKCNYITTTNAGPKWWQERMGEEFVARLMGSELDPVGDRPVRVDFTM
jgi:hypothetical protein